MPITAEIVDSINTFKRAELPLQLYKRGKTRDTYHGPNGTLIIVATDRVSAFDVVLPQAIPYKGHFLTQTSLYAFRDPETADIVQNHFMDSPHPNITVAKRREVYPVEFVVRGYLAGSAWKAYSKGRRNFFGTILLGGLRENERFKSPLFTPTTKADVGHDIPLETWDDYVALIGDEQTARKLREISFDLYEKASKMAERNGYIFVDTKYEFGKPIVLVDEVHTHDSSRMMEAALYERLFSSQAPVAEWDLAWMDKQYLRRWLEVFAGWSGEGEPPTLPNDVIAEVSNRLAGSYKAITGIEPVYPTEPVTQGALLAVLEESGWIDKCSLS